MEDAILREIAAVRDSLADHEKEDAAAHERGNVMYRDLYGNGQPGFIEKTNEHFTDIEKLLAKYAGIGIGIASLVGALSHLLEKLW